MALEERARLRGDLPGLGTGLQAHVREERVVAPRLEELGRARRGDRRERAERVETQMGRVAQVPDHARDAHGHLIAEEERLAQRVRRTEEAARDGFGQHDGVRLREGGRGLTAEPVEFEDVENLVVGPVGARRGRHVAALECGVLAVHARRSLDLRKILAHQRSRPGRHRRELQVEVALAAREEVARDAVDSVGVGLRPIEAELVLHEQRDQDEAREPDRETADVDQRVEALREEMPDGDGDVALEHGALPSSTRSATR